jgi:hypothetical protein
MNFDKIVDEDNELFPPSGWKPAGGRAPAEFPPSPPPTPPRSASPSSSDGAHPATPLTAASLRLRSPDRQQQLAGLRRALAAPLTEEDIRANPGLAVLRDGPPRDRAYDMLLRPPRRRLFAEGLFLLGLGGYLVGSAGADAVFFVRSEWTRWFAAVVGPLAVIFGVAEALVARGTAGLNPAAAAATTGTTAGRPPRFFFSRGGLSRESGAKAAVGRLALGLGLLAGGCTLATAIVTILVASRAVAWPVPYDAEEGDDSALQFAPLMALQGLLGLWVVTGLVAYFFFSASRLKDKVNAATETFNQDGPPKNTQDA